MYNGSLENCICEGSGKKIGPHIRTLNFWAEVMIECAQETDRECPQSFATIVDRKKEEWREERRKEKEQKPTIAEAARELWQKLTVSAGYTPLSGEEKVAGKSD